MPAKKKAEPFVLIDALLNALAINNRINIYLIQNLPAEVWRAEPPGGKGRTVAAIVSHLHNVRLMWLKVAAKGTKIPAQLDRASVTPEQAVSALNESQEAMAALFQKALTTDGRIVGFKPDVASFLGYTISHEAHHRGQISQLARQCGFPLPQKAMFGMWEWGKM